MYRNTYQKGLFTILNSEGSKPLKNWDVHGRCGYVKRIYEQSHGMLVMEMRALISTIHYITCPARPYKNLGIRMQIVNFLVRNLNASFSFEVRVKDTSGMSRRLRCSNFSKRAVVNTFDTTIPLHTNADWVLIYFNAGDFIRKCYGTDFFETERVQVNGNIQIRRIFLSDNIIQYHRLPKEFHLCRLVSEKKEPKKYLPRARPPSPASRSTSGKNSKSKMKEVQPEEVRVSTASLIEATINGSQASMPMDEQEMAPSTQGVSSDTSHGYETIEETDVEPSRSSKVVTEEPET